MTQYIDVVLTRSGVFCVAPPWVVKVGDLVCLQSAITGNDELQEVTAVSTDNVDGDHVKMIEKYIGYPLPRITAKYLRSEVEWDEPVQE